MSRRRAKPILAGLLCQIVLAAAAHADDGACVPFAQPEEPAGGIWKGTLTQKTAMRLPNMPIQVSMTSTWSGDLSFKIQYDQVYAERYEPVPLASCTRPLEGQAPKPGCGRDGEPLDKTLRYKTVQVPTDGSPHLDGDAHVAMKFDMAATGNVLQGASQGGSAQPTTLTVEGQYADDQLGALSLKGSPEESQFMLNYNFQAPGGSFSTGGSMTVNGNGTMNGQMTEQDGDGSGAGNVQVGGGQASVHNVHTSNDGKTDTTDVSVGAPPPPQGTERQEMLRLTIDERECGFLKGKIDTSKMSSAMPGGFQVEVLQNEWSATLEERDVQFEKSVQAFVDEPTPQPMTWEYINSATQRLDTWRAQKNTDYGRCVLRRTQPKLFQMQVQALHTLVVSYPKRCEGATAPVFLAANERILGIMRGLALTGGDQCPDMQKAWDLIANEPTSTKPCQ